MSLRLCVQPLSLALNSSSLHQTLLQGTLFRPLVANIYIKNFLCVFFFAQSTVAQEKDPLAQALDALEIVADQKNILPARQVGMKAGPNLEQCSESAINIDLACGRFSNPGEDSQQGGFARA